MAVYALLALHVRSQLRLLSCLCQSYLEGVQKKRVMCSLVHHSCPGCSNVRHMVAGKQYMICSSQLTVL